MFLNLVITIFIVAAIFLSWARSEALKPLHPDYRIKKSEGLDSFYIEKWSGYHGWLVLDVDGVFLHKTYYDARCYLREYLNKQD